MKKIALCIMTLISCNSFAAQNCVANITETAPEANFALDENLGTALDTTTGLMWSRCALGQTWNADTGACTGQAVQLNWQQALQQSYQYRYANYDDWRMPNIKELMSIIERKCAQPAFNTTVFLDAINDDFWSSTSNFQNASEAWIIAFHNGSNTTRDKELKPFIRLVRTAN